MKLNNSHWLLSRPIAHRGLWNENIPENTLLAYQNAIENGFPIEIDLHRSLDGEIFVFHDDDLSRLTGVKGKIYEKTKSEIKSLTINGTKEKIPTLSETLEFVNGRVPLLIEIKLQPNSKIVLDVVKILKMYKGEFAVQSFNPAYIIKIKKLAPEFTRGVLASKAKFKNKLHGFIVNKMPLNFIAKPHFISFRHTDLPIKRKPPIICWTITSTKQWKACSPYAKNIIFENFIPKK
ncbi:MAG: hypothetical protein IJW43_05960 [Clostridia bacterium]|nr:hypothetical protein [Clostridia bacterium]